MPIEKFCVFEYLYRDAGNWKTFGKLLLSGQPQPSDASAICVQLESKLYFVPEQIGVPPLQQQHLDYYNDGDGDDLDHAFHEFLALRQATPEEMVELQPHGSREALITRIKAVRSWDVRLSPFGQW